ncbi:MAG: cytochrome b/b6 domain-containing protein [Rhizobiaceae bacterium]|nr:cytochrome b/b6 domain-containing protein [Rhizobiaceae bacterium]
MILHWTIALAILFQLAIGFSMSRLDIFPDPLRFSLFQWHKTVGLLILSLTLARIAWRMFNPPPAHGPMPRAEKALAGSVHVLFYALMLLVPLSGWLLVSASPTGIPTLLFLSDILPWPNVPLPSTGGVVEARAEAAHVWLAYSVAGLLVLHVAGALKHSLVDNAPSFSRMLPIGQLPRQSISLVAIPIAAAAVAVFLGGGLVMGRVNGEATTAGAAVVAPPAASSGWTIDKAASRLSYTATFSGKTIGGSIDNWDAAVSFDPEALAVAKASIIVDSASVTIDDSFIRSTLAGADGLDAVAQPQARMELTTFSKTPDGFLGAGTMTIKGTTAPIEVPFTFTENPDGTARVQGSATFDRMAYKLGAANDASGQWLALPIGLNFELQATKR